MKKRMMAFLAVLVMLLSCLPMGNVITAKAEEEKVIKLHYHRPDGQYDGWNVWFWDDGGEGAVYEFALENGEMVATKVIDAGVTKEGFIVRTNDWAKDVAEDQFIEFPEMVSGTLHVYVESGVAGFTKEYSEDSVVAVRMSKARYDGEGTIVTKFTGEIQADINNYFTVMGPKGEVAIKEVKKEANNEYHLVLAEELNGSRSYKVICEGTEYKVVMPIVFSTEKFEEEYTYN
jgi:pullulanase